MGRMSRTDDGSRTDGILRCLNMIPLAVECTVVLFFLVASLLGVAEVGQAEARVVVAVANWGSIDSASGDYGTALRTQRRFGRRLASEATTVQTSVDRRTRHEGGSGRATCRQ